MLGEKIAMMKFINLVKARKCLYQKSYRRKDLEEKAWKDIAQVMGWSVSFCIDKWRNLRNGLVRNLRRKEERKLFRAKRPKSLRADRIVGFMKKPADTPKTNCKQLLLSYLPKVERLSEANIQKLKEFMDLIVDQIIN
ncbi:uncharacterized protein LOC129910244 [Episyrphus balteatus]|uniref:uncharacterized protein LOC129910244 n=1 Tax=Episyrphus balteatus TaxID=286459 RepID=UPI00248591A0|nr:uncharacterized protein LOC129910244 [Episyrphus balteatus]